MGFLSFLAVAVPIGGLAIFIVFLVAMMQEKGLNKGESVRLAFSYVVAIIMLVIVTSSTAFLLQRALKAWVFTKAESQTSMYQQQPPLLWLGSDKGIPGQTAYTCQTDCQFTATDKEQVASWKSSYASWKASRQDSLKDPYTERSQKQDLASAVSFFVVALPLFIWFFIFMIQREWWKHKAAGSKPGPIRTTYFYLVALASLVGLVVSTALVINIGVKSILGVSTDSTTAPRPALVNDTNGYSETRSVQSIIDCTDKCGFSAEDKQLAQQWQNDYQQWQTGTLNSSNAVQNDFANLIPILLVTGPLFFYHFLTIRRESKDETPRVPSTPTAV